MRSWCKILPMWFIIWYSTKYGEKFIVEGKFYTCPYRGVLIAVNTEDVT